MNFLTIIIAKYLIILITGASFLYGITQPIEKRKKYILLLIISGVIALILTKFAGAIYFDPRPFVVNHTAPLIPHVEDNGFPSDHTVLSLLFALAIYAFNQRLGVLLSVLGVAVGLARIHAGIHSPFDIIGGGVIALISVAIAQKIQSLVKIKYAS